MFLLESKMLTTAAGNVERSDGKQFYSETVLRQHMGQALSPKSTKNFRVCALAMLKAQSDGLGGREITKITHDNDQLRLYKHVLPFFGDKDVPDVAYKDGEDFLLPHSPSTISLRPP